MLIKQKMDEIFMKTRIRNKVGQARSGYIGYLREEWYLLFTNNYMWVVEKSA